MQNHENKKKRRYSTPVQYTLSKSEEKSIVWPTKPIGADYMTISQQLGRMYWAGYYTSRPLLKVFFDSKPLSITR